MINLNHEQNEMDFYHGVTRSALEENGELPIVTNEHHTETHRTMLLRRTGVYIIHKYRASLRVSMTS